MVLVLQEPEIGRPQSRAQQRNRQPLMRRYPRLLISPRYVVPGLELILFIPLMQANPRRMSKQNRFLLPVWSLGGAAGQSAPSTWTPGAGAARDRQCPAGRLGLTHRVYRRRAAHSELFSEDFLIPGAGRDARQAQARILLRLRPGR
jgi:hypothetical protein